jgi:hypothetical protein
VRKSATAHANSCPTRMPSVSHNTHIVALPMQIARHGGPNVTYSRILEAVCCRAEPNSQECRHRVQLPWPWKQRHQVGAAAGIAVLVSLHCKGHACVFAIARHFIRERVPQLKYHNQHVTFTRQIIAGSQPVINIEFSTLTIIIQCCIIRPFHEPICLNGTLIPCARHMSQI